MMKKTMTRLISLLMAALILIPSSLPVFAEEAESGEPISQTEEVEEASFEEETETADQEAIQTEESLPPEEETSEETTEEIIEEEPLQKPEEELIIPDETAAAEEEAAVEEPEVPQEDPIAPEEDIKLVASTLPDEIMDLSKAEIELTDEAPIIYDGTAKEPEFILIYKKDESAEEYRVVLNDLKTACDVVYSDNINAGTAKITITYKDDVEKTNKLEAPFTIEKAPQTFNAVVLSTNMYVYEKQSITVSGNYGKLTYASSNKAIATVTSKGVISAVDEGTVSITVKAAGDANHLAGSVVLVLQIEYEEFDIKNCVITLAETQFTYSGSEFCPAVTVTYKDRALAENTEYTLTYSNNINAGKGKVAITPMGHCHGSKVTKTFTIAKAKNPIVASSVNKLYSLKAQSFTLNATAKENAVLSFKSNKTQIKVDAATGKVTIAAGYMGSAKITITSSETANYLETSKTVNVYARYMTKTRILEAIKGILASWDGSWHGSAAYKQIINTYNAYADQIGAGKMQTSYPWCAATVSAAWITAGIAKYTGIEMSCGRFINIAKNNDAWNNDWKSVPKVGDAIIFSYDGSHSSHDHIGMVIAVSKDKKTFTTIEGNTSGSGMYNGKVGTYTYKVSYKNIQGFISYDYSDIANKMKYVKKIDDDTLITVSSIATQNYTGSALRPKPTIKDNGKTLTEGTDYTLYYTSNTAPGTASITIVGKGNYTGVRTVSFTIKASYSYYHVIETDVRYRTGPGTSYSIAGTFKKNQNVKIVKGYSKSANGYTWYAVMIGSNTYYTVSKYLKKGKYVSNTKSINADSITVSKISNKSFKAAAIKPSPTIKDGDTKLVKGTDYTLSYKNNKWPGTATVTITGIGKYSGTRTVTFKIVGKYTKYTAKYALNYRSKPSTSGTIKGTFAQGATVTVLNGYSKSANGYTWVIVKVGTKYYYTAKDFLK